MQRNCVERIQREREISIAEADNLVTGLPDTLKRAVDLAKGEGSSIWLTALSLREYGFTLHKGAFHDAMALGYG